MTDDQIPTRKRRGRLATGIVLLLVGAAMLAMNLGFHLPEGWYLYWPWLLVGLGIAQLGWPGTFRERVGGYWLLIVGAWGLINMYEILGLTWSTSWPLFIIAAGLRVVLGSVFDPRRNV